MIIILITLAFILLSALCLHFYKRIREMREERMRENEKLAAAALCEYARHVKSQIEKAVSQGSGVLDYTNITLPHSHGYRASLELHGYGFRVFAVPDQHNRTGRLSFFADNTLEVRASDRGGAQAYETDPQYQSNPNS